MTEKVFFMRWRGQSLHGEVLLGVRAVGDAPDGVDFFAGEAGVWAFSPGRDCRGHARADEVLAAGEMRS